VNVFQTRVAWLPFHVALLWITPTRGEVFLKVFLADPYSSVPWPDPEAGELARGDKLINRALGTTQAFRNGIHSQKVHFFSLPFWLFSFTSCLSEFHEICTR